MLEITSETWKDAYIEKLRESKKTGVPLIVLCKNDPVWMESHRKDLERLQRFQASGSDAPAPVVMYERD